MFFSPFISTGLRQLSLSGPFKQPLHSAEATSLFTGTALDTLLGVDDKRFLHLAGNGTDGANPGTLAAALALIGNDLIHLQPLADPCRTATVNYMGQVFIPEVLQCSEDRIWCRLAQTA